MNHPPHIYILSGMGIEWKERQTPAHIKLEWRNVRTPAAVKWLGPNSAQINGCISGYTQVRWENTQSAELETCLERTRFELFLTKDAWRSTEEDQQPANPCQTGFKPRVIVYLDPDTTSEGGDDVTPEKSEIGKAQVLLNEAYAQWSAKNEEALEAEGLSPKLIKYLRSWIETTVDNVVTERFLQLQLDLVSARASQNTPPLADDPSESLSAVEMGKALGGVSDETVRLREKGGELFSILRPGRKRGREYPAFQTWPGIAGHPLKQLLAALGTRDGATAHGFFLTPTDLLGGIAPVEALLGRLLTVRDVDPDVQVFLTQPYDQRLATVVQAAKTHAATLQA